jgi:hypothetical protein
MFRKQKRDSNIFVSRSKRTQQKNALTENENQFVAILF